MKENGQMKSEMVKANNFGQTGPVTKVNGKLEEWMGKEPSLMQNKKSVRKAAYFYRMLKNGQIRKKINHGHGLMDGYMERKHMVKVR